VMYVLVGCAPQVFRWSVSGVVPVTPRFAGQLHNTLIYKASA
jgi:hypothetical protein